MPANVMDKECKNLVNAINMVPGLHTTESCCGHGEIPFHIWLRPEKMKNLLPMLYFLDTCHSGIVGWSCECYTDCAMHGVTFMVEGPVGDYEGADKIAEYIREMCESGHAKEVLDERNEWGRYLDE